MKAAFGLSPIYTSRDRRLARDEGCEKAVEMAVGDDRSRPWLIDSWVGGASDESFFRGLDNPLHQRLVDHRGSNRHLRSWNRPRALVEGESKGPLKERRQGILD